MPFQFLMKQACATLLKLMKSTVPLCNTLPVTSVHKQHNLRSLTIYSNNTGNKTQAEVSNKRWQAIHKQKFIPKYLNFSKGNLRNRLRRER